MYLRALIVNQLTSTCLDNVPLEDNPIESQQFPCGSCVESTTVHTHNLLNTSSQIPSTSAAAVPEPMQEQSPHVQVSDSKCKICLYYGVNS